MARGRPSGHITPLRQKAASEMLRRASAGHPVLVSAIARTLSVDRRSARRIMADVRKMGLVAN